MNLCIHFNFLLLIIGISHFLQLFLAAVSINYLGIDQELYYNFVILAMSGYLTAIVRAPITGIVLVMEMTGSFTHILPLTVVSVAAYVVADLLKRAW